MNRTLRFTVWGNTMTELRDKALVKATPWVEGAEILVGDQHKERLAYRLVKIDATESLVVAANLKAECIIKFGYGGRR